MELVTPNVLIVEGDPRQTELVMELVKDVVRAQVDSTNSADRAIELVTRTPYQLVIADCGGVNVDGLLILERVKRVSPTTGVILTSSFASIEESVRAMRTGADEYFKKPINPEHFKLAVQRCLDRRDLYSGDLAVTGLMHLLNACQLVSGCLEEDKILETVVGYIRREASAKGLAMFRVAGDSRTRISTTLAIDPEVVEVVVDGHNFIQACIDEKAAMKTFPKMNTVPEVSVFQFRCIGDAQYFVVVLAPSWSAPAEEIGSRFRLLQAQIQMTGKNIQNYRGVRSLLYLDEPTGLYNTRYLHVHLDRLFQRRDEDRKLAFSVLFLDIDKFKSINDRFGHLIGTKLLQELGHLMKRCLRKNDAAFRYGGDEFVIVLDGVSSGSACTVAESIRAAVEANKFLAAEALNIKLTVSVGVASCPDHASTKREIIDAADSAMYSVKRTSRNKVYISERKAAA